MFTPSDGPMQLDVWVTTHNNRFMNIELENQEYPSLTPKASGASKNSNFTVNIGPHPLGPKNLSPFR